MVVPAAVERRGAERYPLTAFVQWRSGDGKTTNASTTGLYFLTGKRLVPGEAVRLTILLPRQTTPLVGEGVVVRVERHSDGYGVGARLDSLTPLTAAER